MQTPAMPNVYRAPPPTEAMLYAEMQARKEADLIGGLDPRLHRDVQLEMQAMLAAALPLVGLAIPLLLNLFVVSTVGWISLIAGPSAQRVLAWTLMTIAIIGPPFTLILSTILLGDWLARWARNQRHRRVAFALAPLWLLLPLAATWLLPWPWALAAVMAMRLLYVALRSRISGDYCLSRLATYERTADNLVGDAFTFDTRVLGRWGWILVIDVWVTRLVTRPFVRPAPPLRQAASRTVH
jgi:hypothetical protein